MQTFTLLDLRDRTGELIYDAEAGKLSLVTKHGRPVFIAVPFDETLLKYGVYVALAVKLFDEEVISMGMAARLASMSQSVFLDLVGSMHIPVARYGPGEQKAELESDG